MLLVYTSCKSKKEAQRMADECVRRKIAACASIWPVISAYRWGGKLVRRREWALELHVKNSGFLQAKKAILSLHSYSLPRIYSVKPSQALPRYEQWVEKG